MNTYIADEKVVEQITKLPKVRLTLFRDVDVSQQGIVLLKLTKRVRQSVISDLDNDELIALINYLDPDKATDLIQSLSTRRAKKITAELSDTIREKVETLLSFDPRTAAGLMNLDYVVVMPTEHFEDVSSKIKEH